MTKRQSAASTEGNDEKVGGWCLVGQGAGNLQFRYAKPFRLTWRHRLWRVIHQFQDFGRSVAYAMWGTPRTPKRVDAGIGKEAETPVMERNPRRGASRPATSEQGGSAKRQVSNPAPSTK